MTPVSVPDLTAYGAGGLTLVVAVYVVLQSLKRSHPRLRAWITEAVLGVAAALVVSLMLAPRVFAALAGTLVTAALIMLAHGGVKNVSKPP